MTVIGFGTWAWGNKLLWGYRPEKDDATLEATFKTAIDNGLRLVDTADSYGVAQLNGRSEELLGKYIKKISASQLSNLTVATKLAPYPWRLGREGLKKPFEASKGRLMGNLTRVQLHWSTFRYAPWQEVELIEGLADLVEKKHVKEIGLSNMGPKRLKFIYDLLLKRGIKLKSLQIQYSLLAPNPNKQLEIQILCKELNIDLLAYSPLALGVLTKKPEERTLNGTFLRKTLCNQLLADSMELRMKLNEIALERKASQAQVAINWCRYNGAIPIPGVRSPSQAKDAADATKWMLTKKEANELTQLSLNCPVRMPNNPFQSE